MLPTSLSSKVVCFASLLTEGKRGRERQFQGDNAFDLSVNIQNAGQEG